ELIGQYWFCALDQKTRKPLGLAAVSHLDQLDEEDEHRLKQMLEHSGINPEKAALWGYLVVHKNARGRGIGPKLGDARKEFCLKEGFDHSVAVVDKTTAEAIRVFQKHQGRIIGEIDWHGTPAHVFVVDNRIRRQTQG
ncbi:MAG TPA: GNAT family N-acetyltransferase, partial [Candidatus Norongarragalinales archaeon]|nr:GNAT family N-acetyltransferase [Candidatus Norongarragalinales archaeon]